MHEVGEPNSISTSLFIRVYERAIHWGVESHFLFLFVPEAGDCCFDQILVLRIMSRLHEVVQVVTGVFSWVEGREWTIDE